MNINEIREAIRSAFRGKPVSRVDFFGFAARGETTPESDVDILVTPKPEATRSFHQGGERGGCRGQACGFSHPCRC
jgi:predicted nucleotidyltransferase